MPKLSSYAFPLLLVCGLGIAGYAASSMIVRTLPEQPIRIERGDHSAVTRHYGAKTVLFTSTTCSYCMLMKEALDERKVDYLEVQVDRRPDDMAYLTKTLKMRSVPTLVRGDRLMNGFDEAMVERFLTP